MTSTNDSSPDPPGPPEVAPQGDTMNRAELAALTVIAAVLLAATVVYGVLRLYAA